MRLLKLTEKIFINPKKIGSLSFIEADQNGDAEGVDVVALYLDGIGWSRFKAEEVAPWSLKEFFDMVKNAELGV